MSAKAGVHFRIYAMRSTVRHPAENDRSDSIVIFAVGQVRRGTFSAGWDREVFSRLLRDA